MAGGVNLCSLKVWIRRKGISLVVQQVGLSVLIAKAPGSMPGQVTEIPQAAPKAGKRSRKEEGWKGVNTREKFECLNILKAIFLSGVSGKINLLHLKLAQGRGISMNKLFIFPRWDPPLTCGFQFIDFQVGKLKLPRFIWTLIIWTRARGCIIYSSNFCLSCKSNGRKLYICLRIKIIAVPIIKCLTGHLLILPHSILGKTPGGM